MSVKYNKMIVILILLAGILLFNVGYAKLSNANSNLEAVNTGKELEMQFLNPIVVNVEGANKEKTNITLSSDRKSLQFNVSDLLYPGAKVDFSVDVENIGLVPSKIKSIESKGLKKESAIKVIGLDEIGKNNKTLKPGEKCNIKFTVEWDRDNNIIIDEKMNFNFKLNYIQDI